MEHRDHEQQDAEHVAVPASLLPSVLRRLGLEDTPTTRIDEQIAALRNVERHPRGAASLEFCAAALRDPAWEVRAAAVWALGTFGELAPGEALLNALSDEDGSVRAAAFRTLNRINGRVPLEPTLRLLRDADWQVREAVALTLEELGEQPQFYEEMETNLMAQTDFNRHPLQLEQQKDAPALNGTTPLSSIDMRDTSLRKRQRTRSTPHRSRLLKLLNGLAAVLVVGLIIASALILFAHRTPGLGSTPNVSVGIPFQRLPVGCFFIPERDCPHDPFTQINLSKKIAGYTITINRVYADAAQVVIECAVTKGVDHQPANADIGNYSTLKTRQGNMLSENGSAGFGDPCATSFVFEPATMPAVNTRMLSLQLIVTGMSTNTAGQISFQPVTFDFSLPFHSGRAVIGHQTVTVAGKSVTLVQAVATPSETRVYLQQNDAMLNQDNFTLTDNGKSVGEMVASVESEASAPHPSILEALDFEPLFESRAVCVLTVSAPARSHAGPWVFHFTVQ